MAAPAPYPPYFNYPLEQLGELSGGLYFESVNHAQSIRPEVPGVGLVTSMTGSETAGILEHVRKHAAARFSSSYIIGFVPPPSATPREHELEVKLAPKSKGKLTEARRIATY